MPGCHVWTCGAALENILPCAFCWRSASAALQNSVMYSAGRLERKCRCSFSAAEGGAAATGMLRGRAMARSPAWEGI